MNLNADLTQIRQAALDAVEPAAAVYRHLKRVGTRLHLGTQSWDLASCERVLLYAVGKAAPAMAVAAVDIIGPALSAGIVVTKYEHAAGYALPSSLTLYEAGHPVPDANGERAARALIAALSASGPRDLVLLLLSGGGSALLPAPAEGLSLADLQATTDLLLRAGATIDELNTVRKHLSRLKGGQLARLVAPTPLVTLILSDVVGDPLDVIASGPSAPDATTCEEARAVLARYTHPDEVPAAVQAHLETGYETPKPGDAVFAHVHNVIVGSNRQAALAAVERARQLGYHTLLLTTFIEGEAREVAKVAAALARGVRAHGDPLSPPACLVWGGETTVTVRGAGKGGRNQELALAAALALEGMEDVALLALATDGTDGPTDAAGAVINGRTAARARQRGWDAQATLQQNNSYPLLADVGALLRLGPTGTNVNDLLVLLVA